MGNHRETAKHQRAFQVYYETDRDYQKTSDILSVPTGTLRTWGDWFGWKARADRLDREAAEKADREAVKRRAEMLKRHRQAAELMQRRGIERLARNEINSDRDALAAIKEGVALERQVEGMPTWVVEILNADESELRRRFEELDARRRAAMAGGPDSAGDALAVSLNGNGQP